MTRVRRNPYDYGLARLSATDGRRTIEITCLPEEARELSRWLREHGTASQHMPMPVREHTHPRWGPEYRWTMAAEHHYASAHAEYMRECAERRAQGTTR